MKKRLEEAEKKNLELQRVKEELEEKNLELQKIIKERDRFFSIIAHDLRSPFNGFLGLTELLVEESSTITEVDRNVLLKMLNTSAINTYNLLESLLEWSKMQQGTISFCPLETSLYHEIGKMIKIFKDLALSKGIKVFNKIPLDAKVLVDINMFQTIVRNLVSNAIKFSNENDEIIISAEEINSKFIQISIKDTGIGMNPSMVSDLFRLDTNTGRKGTKGEPSSSLGLIICKDFIERHGGKLWVESEEGKGSTFHFILPIK